MTDRRQWLGGLAVRLNMRRLMYQALIRPAVTGDEAGGLGPAVHSQDLERAADSLVDGVRGDVELERDFLRRKVLIDQAQAIELTRAEPRNAARRRCIDLPRNL